MIDRVLPGASWGRAAATGAAPREALRARALVPVAVEPLTGTVLDPPGRGGSFFFVQVLAEDHRRSPTLSTKEGAERYASVGRRVPRLVSITV